jgi:hypothetical protein
LGLVFECEIDGGAASRCFSRIFVAAARASQSGTANATTASRTIKTVFSLFVDTQR